MMTLAAAFIRANVSEEDFDPSLCYAWTWDQASRAWYAILEDVFQVKIPESAGDPVTVGMMSVERAQPDPCMKTCEGCALLVPAYRTARLERMKRLTRCVFFDTLKGKNDEACSVYYVS